SGGDEQVAEQMRTQRARRHHRQSKNPRQPPTHSTRPYAARLRLVLQPIETVPRRLYALVGRRRQCPTGTANGSNGRERRTRTLPRRTSEPRSFTTKQPSRLALSATKRGRRGSAAWRRPSGTRRSGNTNARRRSPPHSRRSCQPICLPRAVSLDRTDARRRSGWTVVRGVPHAARNAFLGFVQVELTCVVAE